MSDGFFEKPSASRMERHLQTALAVMMMSVIGWVGITVAQNREVSARLEEKVVYLSKQLEEMKVRLDGAPAASEMNNLRRQVGDHEQRLRALEHGKR